MLGVRPTAGPVDVVVTSGGRTTTLANGFTFVAPSGANRPPTVTSIRSVGSRPGQPPLFADLNETVTLIATASDAETPVNSLTFEWTGPGSFTGSGSTVMWHVPAGAASTPLPVGVGLTLVESYVEGTVTHVNRSDPAAIVLQVHDSQNEIMGMGEDFLTLFSKSDVPTDTVLHNFSTTCDQGAGRAQEKLDTDTARRNYTQNFNAFRVARRPPVTIDFVNRRCQIPDGRVQRNVDACSSYTVHWEITYLRYVDSHSPGDREVTDGIDFVSAALENNQWRLCHSDFLGTSTNLRTGLTRSIAW
jgi:hypothetical protein